MRLLEENNVELEGKHAVIIGRSNIVGRPMSEMLLRRHATITVTHDRTQNLAEICRTADVIVSACGQPEMIKGDWIKPGATIIDCGINAIADPSKKSGQRLVGDVAYEECAAVAGAITPVPGGVGPMTVAELLNNTADAAIKVHEADNSTVWSLTPTKLNKLVPVPSDIDIAKAAFMKPISQIAEEVGIKASELDLHGVRFFET
jgi:methylenetetrahydrofolate dehydrogenase (NADP+)/methenyltetrahydrofolate cyclohydrolase/formyltetrahydrofolate synthetase